MRYLTIVRHAKAANPTAGQSDFDRPLTKKGRAQAQRLREWVIDESALGQFGPTTALVSAAARTRETYAVAFAGTAFVHAVDTSESVYNGRRDVSAHDVVTQLAAMDPVSESLLFVGHNPTVFELARTLCREKIPLLANDRFPLGSALVVAIRDDEPLSLAPATYVAGFDPED